MLVETRSLMKILTTITYYYPHWTGLTAYAQRLAEGLAARGHQVTVLASLCEPGLAAEDEHNGVRIVRLRSLFRLSRGQVMPAFPLMVNRLLYEHDVVQVHTPMLETGLVGALAHRAGRKMLVTHHGDLVMPSGFWNQFVQLTVGYLQNRGAASADVISIHSQDYADHSAYLRPYAGKIVAIYPPVEMPRPDLQAVASWRQELGLDGARVVGFAGRFVEEKGFDYLLKAVPLVIEKMPDVRFIYAGDLPVYENFFQRWRHLADANRSHVQMLGLIRDRQKLANFYALCDAFALPGRTDCFPSVQIEAQLCGTPVVTTNIPGAREVVKVDGMGLLVEPQNERALAEGLIQVLGQRANYVKPYEHVRAIFNTEKAITAYESLLQSLIS